MRMGTEDLSLTDVGAIRNIARMEVHPKYVSTRAYYDAGIAIADVIIEFTDVIRPISLPMLPIDDSDEDAFDGKKVYNPLPA